MSKTKSLAKYLDDVSSYRFFDNAGVIGLLVGYKLKEVIDHLRVTGEDELKAL